MPLPNGVALLKIHPAIAIARTSPNPDYFIFDQTPASYKSNGMIKRQAVQFRIVSYDDHGHELASYLVDDLRNIGINVVWRVKVANKKVARIRGTGQISGALSQYVIKAEARSDQSGGTLIGRMTATDFQEGQAIPLGQIHRNGLFEPSQGIIYRANATAPLPNSSMHSPDVSDTTCDGVVEADLTDMAGAAVPTRVLPAWLVIAPPDFSPDLVDTDLYTGDIPPRRNLSGWLSAQVGAPDPVNNTANAFDRKVLRQGTDDFAPGIECGLSLSSGLASEHGGSVKPLFLSPAETHDPSDMRLDSSKLEPGDMTAYLCSPWQFDFRVCGCSFWAAQRPDWANRDETANLAWSPANLTKLEWMRLIAASTGRGRDGHPPDGGRLTSNADFVWNAYKLGIIRVRDGEPVETERLDDIAGQV